MSGQWQISFIVVNTRGMALLAADLHASPGNAWRFITTFWGRCKLQDQIGESRFDMHACIDKLTGMCN